MSQKICDFLTYICQKGQLGFSSKIKVPQLGSAWLGTFIAQLELENSGSGSSHYLLIYVICMYFLEHHPCITSNINQGAEEQ